jgi:hypothetical protein
MRLYRKQPERIKREKMFCASELKERGWTQTAINNFAPGVPDDTLENSLHKSGPPRRLWLKSRIYRIEKGEQFLAWKKRSSVRKAAASASSVTKRSDRWIQATAAEMTSSRVREIHSL